MFQPHLETLPREQLRILQNERFLRTFRRVYEQVPFFRQRFKQTGLEPEDIRSMDDLRLLPFTNKEDLRVNYPFGLFAEPIENVARLHASSGTTGKLTVVGYTRNDLQVFGEVCARCLSAAGAKPGMMLHNAYGYGLFTGGLGLHAGAETLGMTVVPVSGGMTDRQVTLLLDFKPQVISCTPSYALTLAETFRKQGIGPADHQLRFALLGAEPWTETIRLAVESGLGVRATNIYGLSEIIGPGVAQEALDEQGTGSYIWEDHFFPEVLDRETGLAVADGETGELTITTLTKEALPLIRYRTGDITWLRRDHGGGRTHVKMGPVLGRTDDMLIIRGVNVFPSQVEEVLLQLPELSACYQIIVNRIKTLDEVLVQVEWNPPAQAMYGDPGGSGREAALRTGSLLQQLIRDRIGLTMTIELVSAGSLPRSEGGKTGHVHDRRSR